MKMIISLAMVLGGASLLFAVTSFPTTKGEKVDNAPLESLDLDRYLGVWYEIARYPHFFEKGMTRVKATYTPLPGGKIEVRNEGFKDGKPKVAKGKARTTDIPGRLMVTFFLFPAEYNILEVGPNYSYSVVGGSNDKYLWILSRTPTLPQEVLEGIYERLRARGYDLSKLILVEQ